MLPGDWPIIVDGVQTMIPSWLLAVSGALFFVFLVARFWPEKQNQEFSAGVDVLDIPSPRPVHLPETKNWIDQYSARMLVLQSSAILKIKASWNRGSSIAASFQDAVDRIDGSDRIKFQDKQIADGVNHYLNKAVYEFPEIKKDGKYSKVKLKWWLEREAVKL